MFAPLQWLGPMMLLYGCCLTGQASELQDGQCVDGTSQGAPKKGRSLLQKASSMNLHMASDEQGSSVRWGMEVASKPRKDPDWVKVDAVLKDQSYEECSINFCDYGTRCRTEAGRGDPKCCQEHAWTMLQAVTDYFAYRKMEHWAVYGLLLGAIRDQDYIPWETDVDLQLPPVAYDKLFDGGPSLWTRSDLPFSFKFFTSDIGRACVIYKNSSYTKYDNRTSFAFDTIPYIDLYPCNSRGFGTYPQCSRGNRTRRIRGLPFRSPDEDIDHLFKTYGTDWNKGKPGDHSPDPKR